MASTTPADTTLGSADAVVLPQWRAFGRAPDVDIDFSTVPRSALVTRVLALCRTEPASEETPLWQLTLAGRIGALAAIVALTEDSTTLVADLRCGHGACAQPFEVDLDASALMALAEEAERQRVLDIGPGGTRLRRPTGDDQRRWQAERYADATQAERAILESLLMDKTAAILDADTVARFDTQLAHHDPLVSFSVTTVCPSCDHEQEFTLDLEAWLLARLEQHQRALLRDTHRLALSYGWRESDILALPAWRRRAYLQHVERESTR